MLWWLSPGQRWDTVTWCGWDKLWKSRRRCQLYSIRGVCWWLCVCYLTWQDCPSWWREKVMVYYYTFFNLYFTLAVTGWLRLGWMDGVKCHPLGNRETTTEAVRQCVKDRKEWRWCSWYVMLMQMIEWDCHFCFGLVFFRPSALWWLITWIGWVAVPRYGWGKLYHSHNYWYQYAVAQYID